MQSVSIDSSPRMSRGGGRGGFDSPHFRNSGNGHGMSDAGFPGKTIAMNRMVDEMTLT